MSLVAYGSSDESEESDSEANEIPVNGVTQSNVEKAQPNLQNSSKTNENKSDRNVNIETESIKEPDSLFNDPHISDEDDDFYVSGTTQSTGLHLPAPVNASDSTNFGASQNYRSVAGSAENASILDLPAPRSSQSVSSDKNLDGTDELEDIVKPKPAELAKREKPPDKKKKIIKISAASLAKYDSDEEEPEKKKLKPSSVGSGLFAMLPKPKNVSIKEAGRALVPHTLTKRPTKQPSKPSVKPAVKPTKRPSLVAAEESDEEEGDVNFFSFGGSGPAEKAKTSVTSTERERLLLSSASYSVTSSTSTLPGVRHQDTTEKSPEAESSGFVGPSAPGPSQLEDYNHQPMYTNQHYMAMAEVADEEETEIIPADELLRLQGRGNRRREDISNIIDVHADSQTSTMDLTKNLTEEVDLHTHSKKNKDQPSSQQKRKHQITYLAHKAKEREFDLKNQWAQNKMTKQQTQSRYGF